MAKKVLFGGVPGMMKEDIEKMERYVLEEYPGVDYHFYGEQTLSREDLLAIGKDADVLISWDQEMDDELYAAMNLTAYCAASIGFNAANLEAATRQGVYVANIPDYCTDEVATHAITLMLALYRKFYKMVDYIKGGNWDLSPMEGIRRFETSTVGLLGFGRIPRAVAKKLSGFGVEILAYDPFVSAEDMAALGVKKAELDDLLSQSDYISLHSPLMPSTKHMINKESIEKMKDGAFLINTARGGLVDEEALYDALRRGKIQAAGLDVLTHEPPSEIGQKLIALDNTIVTGHSSYVSLEAADAQIRMTAKNVASFLAGQVPQDTVNKKLNEK